MNYILDAGALIALMNRQDDHHPWARNTLPGLARPWLVCEPVLAEIAALTGKPLELVRELDNGTLKLAFDLHTQRKRVAELLETYADRNMDLADACVLRMSELFRHHTVITVDRTDFKVYRRNGREAVPILAPPED